MNNENIKETIYSVTVRESKVVASEPSQLKKPAQADQISQRKRGKNPLVSLTVRLKRTEWERLHQLAVAEGCSIQYLAATGLSNEFVKRGLRPLDETGCNERQSKE